MKVITVGNGYIAAHLPYEIAKWRVTTDEQNLELFFKKYKPDVIVNCTGFCGRPNVDQCEVQKSKTYMANVIVPAVLAQECEARGIRMVHIGSGCIYFGESPNVFKKHTPEKMKLCPIGVSPDEWIKVYDYKSDEWTRTEPGWKETDFANPKSYYSKTKYACDLMLGQMPNVTTLRIRMPISTQNNQRNFINKIRGYSQVIDIPNSVTFIDDLTRCIDWSITTNQSGIFHVTNPEPLSAADVMREYQKYDPSHAFSIIDETELDRITTAKRSNCIIDSTKLKNAGFTMTPSKEALERCMAEYAKTI
jgi:dTDP-4-dehydrorhamnose reductase